MQTMHSTLLIGPANWDRTRLPLELFRARLTNIWRAIPDAAGIIAFGSAAEHSGLAYLTNFTPKLEPAIALIPRDGEAMLMVGGGVNMLPAAQPLTWIERLSELRGFTETISQWINQSLSGRPVLMIGGDAMPFGMRRRLDAAILTSGVSMLEGDRLVRQMMRTKCEREHIIMAEATAILQAACGALKDEFNTKSHITATILAAENAAYRQGAQDVRTLISLDGGRTLRPLEKLEEGRLESLQAYIGVKYLGYWVEGFVRIALAQSPEWMSACKFVEKLSALVEAGQTYGAIRRKAAELLGDQFWHPAVAGCVVPLGMSIDDHGDDGERLELGEFLSIRAGILGKQGAAIASAIVFLQGDGAKVIWASG